MATQSLGCTVLQDLLKCLNTKGYVVPWPAVLLAVSLSSSVDTPGQGAGRLCSLDKLYVHRIN